MKRRLAGALVGTGAVALVLGVASPAVAATTFTGQRADTTCVWGQQGLRVEFDYAGAYGTTVVVEPTSSGFEAQRVVLGGSSGHATIDVPRVSETFVGVSIRAEEDRYGGVTTYTDVRKCDYWPDIYDYESDYGYASPLGTVDRVNRERTPQGYLFRGQYGRFYHSDATGRNVVVRGGIYGLYSRLGEWTYRGLGFPVRSEYSTPSGAVYQDFEGGTVYAAAGAGIHEVHGWIRGLYAALGNENSFLGFPVSDEVGLGGGGAVNHFQGGSIYSSPRTGAHEVHGLIREAYWRSGAERGEGLGYPTSDEFATSFGAQSNFERGRIEFDRATGTTRVVRG